MSLLNSTTASSQRVLSVTFGWCDYVIFATMLGISTLIGIYFGYFGSKQSTTTEYLLGGKTMKVFPIVVSLVASHVSGINLLGVPADVFRYGAAYWLAVISKAILPVLIIYVYLPIYFNLQITSSYEYLEVRFDSRTRKLAAFGFPLTMFLFLPIVIYVPSLAVAAAVKLDVHYITPIVSGICVFYTTIGGLKAVVWTDTFQFILTFGAVVTTFILGCLATGGLGNVWRKSVEGHRLDIFDFDLDPTKRDSFWMLTVGYTMHFLSYSAANQGCIQKFVAVATFEESKKTVWWYAFGMALISTFNVLIGLVMYARYADCDPFKIGGVQRNDQLLPYYVMDVAGSVPGLPGLFIAGIVSASLSTLSANFNSMSATIYEDFISDYMPASTTEKTASNVLKLIVLIVGVICTALVYLVEHLGGILPLAIAFDGVCSGPSFGLFSLGVLVPRCSSKGAFWGCIIGMVCMCWIVFGAQYYILIGEIVDKEKPTSVDGCPAYMNITATNNTKTIAATLSRQPFFIYRISRYYYTLVGTIITMSTGYLISRFTKDDKEVFRLDLISPLVHSLVPKGKNIVANNSGYCSADTALHKVTYNSTEEEDAETSTCARNC